MEKSSFTDPRDGIKYKTVQIGTQIWMAEDLCYYRFDVYNFSCHGLYTLEMARESCLPGWHIPSYEEWGILSDFVGEKSGNGTDVFGFAAMPCGIRYGWNYEVQFAGDYGFWWSDTEVKLSEKHGDYAAVSLSNYSKDIAWGCEDKNCFLSVRCVKD